MKIWLAMLLVSVGCLAQRPVEIAFDNIKTIGNDSNGQYFELTYHISNLSDTTISFILDTDYLVPVIGSSLTAAPHYKIYKDGKAFDVACLFVAQISNENNPNPKRKASDSKNVRKEKTDDPDPYRIRFNEITLGKNEKLPVTLLLKWDKNRYQSWGENEFYIDKESRYEIELSMHLLKDELQHAMSEYQLSQVKKDELTGGWFTSNKLPIVFSDK